MADEQKTYICNHCGQDVAINHICPCREALKPSLTPDVALERIAESLHKMAHPIIFTKNVFDENALQPKIPGNGLGPRQ